MREAQPFKALKRIAVFTLQARTLRMVCEHILCTAVIVIMWYSLTNDLKIAKISWDKTPSLGQGRKFVVDITLSTKVLKPIKTLPYLGRYIKYEIYNNILSNYSVAHALLIGDMLVTQTEPYS